jgi:2,5-furandicarboxylate decarboxylase 1
MDLRQYLQDLREKLPEQLLTIKKPVNPADFEATAILQHLENNDQYPAVMFENAKNVNGTDSAFPSLINVFASRERCALAMNLDVTQKDLPLSLEYAAREKRLIEPTVISREEAPVKHTVLIDEEVDLSALPIVRFHEMDPAPIWT